MPALVNTELLAHWGNWILVAEVMAMLAILGMFISIQWGR